MFKVRFCAIREKGDLLIPELQSCSSDSDFLKMRTLWFKEVHDLPQVT